MRPLASVIPLIALLLGGCGVTEPKHGGHFSPVELAMIRASAVLAWIETDIVPIAKAASRGEPLDPRQQALLADARPEFARAVRMELDAEEQLTVLTVAIKTATATKRDALAAVSNTLTDDLHRLIARIAIVSAETGWPAFDPLEP